MKTKFMLYYSKFKVPVLKRYLVIAKNEKGICEISFSGNEKQFVKRLYKKYRVEAKYSLIRLKNEVQQIQEYYNGERKKFNFSLSIKGTEFQKRVWHEISKVPYGETISYSNLAKKIKNRNAVRAVGSACGKTPVPIVVPCHRVISNNGSIGGFGGGIDLKVKMLEMEKLLK
jgi:methylated-DNA-[protein]-cysteine S-methyltransferase